MLMGSVYTLRKANQTVGRDQRGVGDCSDGDSRVLKNYLNCFCTYSQFWQIWDIAQRSFVEKGGHFRGSYCLHHQDDE
jgi:hypothetical protein